MVPFKFLFFIPFFCSLLLVVSCEDSSNDNPSWKTIFEDNFDRADGSIGSNWSVDPCLNATMSVSNNQLLYTSTSASNDNLGSTYVNIISSSKTRIVIKVRTGANADMIEFAGFGFVPNENSDIFYLLAVNKTYLALEKNKFSTSETLILDSKNVSLDNNTDYYLEYIVDGSSFCGYLKDSSGLIISQVTKEDLSYSSWYIGFCAGSYGPTSFSFDDFKIEIYK